MKKVAILGGGQLGTTLQREHPDWVVFRGEVVLKLAGLQSYYHQLFSEFDVIINTIAQTDTRQCDVDISIKSLSLNGLFPVTISRYCATHGKKFIHISTGCLYRQTDGPNICRETDCVDPLTQYALQKYYGEKLLAPNDLILRGRLFYGTAPSKSNLITKMKTFKSFSTVANSMTSVHTMSFVIPTLMEDDAVGIYNVVNRGKISLFELAKLVGLEGDQYEPLPGAYRAPDLELSIDKLLGHLVNIPCVWDEFQRCWKNYHD